MGKRKHDWGGLLILVGALTLMWMWIARPRDFLDVQPMDQAEKFYIWTSSDRFYEAHPEREELELLLELLEQARLRPERRGSQRMMGDVQYYGFSCSRPDGAGWEEIAGFDFGADGMVYAGHPLWGLTHYRLTDCDLPAVLAELDGLLGMREEPSK